jgi:hypothetical protein
VTDGADVQMRFRPLKLLFGHNSPHLHCYQ